MSMSTTDSAWVNMKERYQKMGLSEEEIAERIIYKTTKLTNRKLHLDKCDHKQTGSEKP